MNEPSVLLHVALREQLRGVLHSSTSLQTRPLPLKPVLHAHVNEPFVFAQRALAGQLCVVLLRHSLLSLQATPSPAQPGLHAHVKEPFVFAQIALVAQLSLPSVHSFWSLQPMPLPSPEKPAAH
jgi:hypothetical protein